MAADSGMPDRLSAAIRLGVFWISLPFIFLLVGVDRFFDNHLFQAATCWVLSVLSIVVAFYWEKLIPGRFRPAFVSDTQRYMTAYEVIHYLADDSKRGHQVRHGPSAQVWTNRFGTINVRKIPLLEAQAEFKRIAEQGHIHAIGRLDGGGQQVQIPETYWMSATLNHFSLENPEISETTPAVANPDGIPNYKNVKILQSDVERIWPR